MSIYQEITCIHGIPLKDECKTCDYEGNNR